MCETSQNSYDKFMGKTKSQRGAVTGGEIGKRTEEENVEESKDSE
jgi:hypothetical protein